MLELPIWLFVILIILSFFGLIILVFGIIGILTEKYNDRERVKEIERAKKEKEKGKN